MKKKDNLVLFIIYFLAALFSFPILRYLILFYFEFNEEAEDRFAVTRVFFSGPTLTLVGISLFVIFRKFLHRAFGVLFMLGGVVWVILIIKAISSEAT